MADQLIAGIDLGTTRFTVAIAERSGAEGFRYLAHGSRPSGGMRAGEIFDEVAFQRAFASAMDEIRTLSGARIDDVVVSVSGATMVGVTNQGQVNVDTGYPIYQPDVDRAIAAARGAEKPGYRTVHRIVQGFAMNGERVRNPIGRTGQTLQVYIRDFMLPESLIDSIQRAAAEESVRVQAIVPAGVGAGEAVLRPDERERGVIVLDMGDAGTDIALYSGGTLWEVAGVPLGGQHVTRDLAALLDLSFEEAEALKRRHGLASVRDAAKLEIDWSPRGIAALQNQARQGRLTRDVPRVVCGARFEQILGDIADCIDSCGAGLQFHAGVVITGGASRLLGAAELIQERLHLPVRTGHTLAIAGFPEISDPGASAAIGLVRYCAARAGATVGEHRRPVRHETSTARQPWSGFESTGPLPATTPQQSSAPQRQWRDSMREWMRGFIPSGGDA